MSATGISPVPTTPTRLDLVRMELEKRVYIIPSKICGWLAEAKSRALTCADESASCINIGSYRGCCNGPTTDCAAYFITQCLPAASLEGNFMAESCIALSPNPDSTTSPRPTPITTSLRTGSASSSQMSPPSSSGAFPSGAVENSTSPPTTAATSKANPAGAIAGAVVGGLAVIALCILGIFYIMHRQKDGPPPPSTVTGGDNNFMHYAPAATQSPPPVTVGGGGDNNSMHPAVHDCRARSR
ncbi:hypothetical protein GE09DRAFT_1233559 [Coniochaeta sp. 2T2.1]|nr:hypothetical protein GE09DRAFT_1233559 [Coniochaeta sp. 2T2.1]